MRHIIFVTLISLFSLTCEASETWYYGSWVADQRLTSHAIKDSHKELNAGKFIHVLDGFVIKIDKNYIYYIKDKNIMKLKYKPYSKVNGIIKLKTKNKDMNFGRDKYGVFYLGTETIKENGRIVKSTNFRIYLKAYKNR